MSEWMIEVSGLTKKYAGVTAVGGVSFRVGRGEVVGLVGPNGAGKSTILRILSSYLPGTSGSVRVAGYDVFREADAVRSRIGYMPEHNPLPLEMRVREYLRFRARLKGLSWGRTRERVGIVMHQCGLTDVGGRILGQLSKGYRQRVGLADALVHEPELIILDEPTIGLDPNQIRAVRQLIKELAQSRTVLLSTHLLPEVELTCHRVLILHHGKLLAEGTTSELRKTLFEGGQVLAEIAAPASELRQSFEDLESLAQWDISPLDGEFHRCALTPRNGVDLRPLVFDLVRRQGWGMRELSEGRHTLEDIFVRLTRADREEEHF